MQELVTCTVSEDTFLVPPDTRPVVRPPYRSNPRTRSVIDNCVKEMLELEIMEERPSAWVRHVIPGMIRTQLRLSGVLHPKPRLLGASFMGAPSTHHKNHPIFGTLPTELVWCPPTQNTAASKINRGSISCSARFSPGSGQNAKVTPRLCSPIQNFRPSSIPRGRTSSSAH